MVTITFKLCILVLFVFGFLEVSCRQRIAHGEGIYKSTGIDAKSINDVIVHRRRRDNGPDPEPQPESRNDDDPEPQPESPITTTSSTTTTTEEAPSDKPVSNAPSPNATSVQPPATVKFSYRKKQHVSLTAFSIFSLSGYCLSANFITLMLLLTNKICVSKKKQPVLQSPTPMPN